MIGPLSWDLCDLEQTVLASLDDRRGGSQVDISRHTARQAQLRLALDDPAASLVSVGDTVLRCQVESWTDPLFVGRVSSPVTTLSGDEEGLVITALDPWTQLQRAIILALNTAFNPDAYAYLEYTAIQQATILGNLIAAVAANGHGVVAGSLPSSVTRTLSFPAGSNVAEQILSVIGMFNGPEFELTPTIASDGTLATFNVFHPQQGSDLSESVIFKIGIGDDDSVTELSYAPELSGMVNRHAAIGDASGIATKGGLDYPIHPAYVAEHAASIAQYGTFESSESLSGTTDASILEASAKAIVAANAYPIAAFSITLDPDTGPEFGPDADCWMGDTIGLRAGLPDEVLELEGRIASASLVEAENREVDVALACEPDAASGVTGSAISVVMDAGEGTVPPAPEIPAAPEPVVFANTARRKKK